MKAKHLGNNSFTMPQLQFFYIAIMVIAGYTTGGGNAMAVIN